MQSVLDVLGALAADDVEQQGRAGALAAVRAVRLESLRDRGAAALWTQCQDDLRNVSRGLREVALVSGAADKATLAALYFALLASEDCPVRAALATCTLHHDKA